MNKSVKYLMMAGAAMLAGSAVAFNQQFSGTAGEPVSISDASQSWNGNGKFQDASPSPCSAVGVLATMATEQNGTYLNVKGTVVCSNLVNDASTANFYTADYLVFVEEPVLELLGEDEDSSIAGAQIAVAGGTNLVGSTTPLNVYCLNGSARQWVETDAVLTTGAWQRVTLVFNYTNNRCLVSVNGVPAASAAGFTSAESDVAGGAWYKFANTPASHKINTMSFIGSGNIDEVVVAGTSAATQPTANGLDSATAAVEVGGVATTVPLADLAKWGVSASSVATLEADDSGMTVADKLAAGLDPTDGSKFEIQSIKATSATEVEIVLPRTYNASNDKGYRVTYVVKNKNGDTLASSQGTVSGEEAKVTATLGDSVGVEFLTVETTTADL